MLDYEPTFPIICFPDSEIFVQTYFDVRTTHKETFHIDLTAYFTPCYAPLPWKKN